MDESSISRMGWWAPAEPDDTVDGAGDVFIADTGNNRVVEIPVVGGALASAKPEKFTVIGGGQSTLRCRLHSLQLSASTRLIDYADRASTQRLPDFLERYS